MEFARFKTGLKPNLRYKKTINIYVLVLRAKRFDGEKPLTGYVVITDLFVRCLISIKVNILKV